MGGEPLVVLEALPGEEGDPAPRVQAARMLANAVTGSAKNIAPKTLIVRS